MKKIEAFIRHEAFEPIRTELLDKGFPSLSISEVKGSGRQKGIVETYRGSSLTVNVRPKLKIEVVIEDKDKSLVVETILKHARTGDVGDGKIFVIPVEEAIRIRTGEEGEEVLQAHTGRRGRRRSAEPTVDGGAGLRSGGRLPPRGSSRCATFTRECSPRCSRARACAGSPSWRPRRPARPVAIVLPARGLAAAPRTSVELEPLGAAAAARLRGDRASSTAALEVEAEVEAGGELIG